MDHTKVYYSSFRKDFYVEVPELAKMTDEGMLLSLELLQFNFKIQFLELFIISITLYVCITED